MFSKLIGPNDDLIALIALLQKERYFIPCYDNIIYETVFMTWQMLIFIHNANCRYNYSKVIYIISPTF